MGQNYTDFSVIYTDLATLSKNHWNLEIDSFYLNSNYSKLSAELSILSAIHSVNL